MGRFWARCKLGFDPSPSSITIVTNLGLFGCCYLAKRLYVLAYPIEDLSKAKFQAVHRAVDELVPLPCIDFEVEPDASREDVRGTKGDPLVAVEDAVIAAQRLHQRGRLFFDGVVIAYLGTENGGLNCILVANAVQSSEPIDQEVLHEVHLRNRHIVRHLFGEPLQQIMVVGHRLLEGIHYLGANQVLRRNHIVQVVSQRLFEYVPLRLPVLLGIATSSSQSLASISGAICLVILDGMIELRSTPIPGLFLVKSNRI